MTQDNTDYGLWTRFMEADYLVDAKTYEGNCPICHSPRDCNNYYCLHCKVGGLCPITFRAKRAHEHHRWLQVRRQSRKSAVDPEDLSVYLPVQSIKHIQKSSLNANSLCYLRTEINTDNNHIASSSRGFPSKSAKSKFKQPSRLKRCEACNKTIVNSQECKEDFLLCSVQCLVTLAQRHPERNLLQLHNDVLAPTDEFPLTSLEKIKGGFTVSPPKPSSMARPKAPVVIVDRSGISSGDENINAAEPAELESRSKPLDDLSQSSSGDGNIVMAELAEVVELPADRRSSGRRSGPVNYRKLHRGGTGAAAAARTPAAGTRGTGGGFQRRSASPTQAVPDFSEYQAGYRSEGLDNLIKAAMTMGDWDHHLGDRGRD